MSLQPYYEESYHTERGRSATELMHEVTTYSKGLFNFVVESKNRFLPNVDWSGLKILEMGAGRGGLGLLLARLGAQVTLVDFSPTALDQAKMIFALEGLEVKTIQGDVTHPDLMLPHKYDIIVDSHLLHCLTEDPDRSSYYQLIRDHLSENGIFVAESMVHRKKLFIPDGFMFDEKNVLWQMFGKWTPIRRILDSLDLEKELSDAHFNIVYFYYYGQYGFVPHRSFMDIPAEILPAAVRMVVQKKQL
ncbi:MAG: class I SAM-dependent methyltransferase [Bacteriovoracaceae bacterium]|nr:class I SAM-dependent methyltransferase [Bacteriovoracaceae bacterium]